MQVEIGGGFCASSDHLQIASKTDVFTRTLITVQFTIYIQPYDVKRLASELHACKALTERNRCSYGRIEPRHYTVDRRVRRYYLRFTNYQTSKTCKNQE